MARKLIRAHDRYIDEHLDAVKNYGYNTYDELNRCYLLGSRDGVVRLAHKLKKVGGCSELPRITGEQLFRAQERFVKANFEVCGVLIMRVKTSIYNPRAFQSRHDNHWWDRYFGVKYFCVQNGFIYSDCHPLELEA